MIGLWRVVVGRFSPALQRTFLEFTDQVTADDFLANVCVQLSEAYFPYYATPSAHYLTALIRSPNKQVT